MTHTNPSSDPNPQATHPLKLLLHVKGNLPPFVLCLSSYIHPSQFQGCLSDVPVCRALPPPDWLLGCVYLCAGSSSLTVYKPEDLCFALVFFLRSDHLLIVLFCLSSKFWIIFSQQIFSFSLKSVSIPIHSSKKTLIKQCVQTIWQSNSLPVSYPTFKLALLLLGKLYCGKLK